MQIPPETDYTQPFWLRGAGSPYLYRVEDQHNIGLAELPPPFRASVQLSINGADLTYDFPVLYRWVDPVEGERYRVFEVVPEISVHLDEAVTVFANGPARSVKVSVSNQSAGPASGNVSLRTPPGWSAIPPEVMLALPYLAVIAALAISGRNVAYPGAYLKPYRRS